MVVIIVAKNWNNNNENMNEKIDNKNKTLNHEVSFSNNAMMAWEESKRA